MRRTYDDDLNSCSYRCRPDPAKPHYPAWHDGRWRARGQGTSLRWIGKRGEMETSPPRVLLERREGLPPERSASSGCCQLSLLGEHYVIYQINRQEFDSLACVKASFRHEQLLHSGTPIVSRIPYPKRRSVPRTGISLTGQSCSSLSPLHLAPIAGSIHRRLPPLPPYTYTFLPLSQITHPDPIGPISRPINTQLVILYAR